MKNGGKNKSVVLIILFSNLFYPKLMNGSVYVYFPTSLIFIPDHINQPPLKTH